jgi:hypothetical protein
VLSQWYSQQPQLLFLPAISTHGALTFAELPQTLIACLHFIFIRVIHHGKTYPSTAARSARRATFERNIKFVDFLNAEDPTATFAMTQVMGFTSTAFDAMLRVAPD